eukprot:6197801-Pleurochrysis_carterae.AAC.3
MAHIYWVSVTVRCHNYRDTHATESRLDRIRYGAIVAATLLRVILWRKGELALIAATPCGPGAAGRTGRLTLGLIAGRADGIGTRENGVASVTCYHWHFFASLSMQNDFTMNTKVVSSDELRALGVSLLGVQLDFVRVKETARLRSDQCQALSTSIQEWRTCSKYHMDVATVSMSCYWILTTDSLQLALGQVPDIDE